MFAPVPVVAPASVSRRLRELHTSLPETTPEWNGDPGSKLSPTLLWSVYWRPNPRLRPFRSGYW
jgi:hypothetical protein